MESGPEPGTRDSQFAMAAAASPRPGATTAASQLSSHQRQPPEWHCSRHTYLLVRACTCKTCTPACFDRVVLAPPPTAHLPCTSHTKHKPPGSHQRPSIPVPLCWVWMFAAWLPGLASSEKFLFCMLMIQFHNWQLVARVYFVDWACSMCNPFAYVEAGPSWWLALRRCKACRNHRNCLCCCGACTGVHLQAAPHQLHNCVWAVLWSPAGGDPGQGQLS